VGLDFRGTDGHKQQAAHVCSPHPHLCVSVVWSRRKITWKEKQAPCGYNNNEIIYNENNARQTQIKKKDKNMGKHTSSHTSGPAPLPHQIAIERS